MKIIKLRIINTQTRKKTELVYENILKILAIKINLANIANYNQFVYFI